MGVTFRNWIIRGSAVPAVTTLTDISQMALKFIAMMP